MMVQRGTVATGSSGVGFAGRVLLASLALTVTVAGFVGLPMAVAAPVSHTYLSDDLCDQDDGLGFGVSYEDAGQTHLVIDLDELAEEVPGVTEVIVGTVNSRLTMDCIAQLVSMEFRQSGTQVTSLTIGYAAFEGAIGLESVVFPAGLETLTISYWAFQQVSLAGEVASLETVVFPHGLRELSIAMDAFSQKAYDGGTMSLKSVVFPEGLETLHIDEGVFRQGVFGGGDTALESVVFPDSLRTLTIGSGAFYQSVSGGGSTTLESVVFPSGLQELEIQYRAFCQEAYGGTTTLRQFVFPTSESPAATVTLGGEITGLETSAGFGVVPWLWTGVASNTSAAWGASGDSYPLLPYAQVTFDPNGGALPGADVDESVTELTSPVWHSYVVLDFGDYSFDPVVLPEPVDGSGDDFGWEFVGWGTAASGVPLADLMPVGASFAAVPGVPSVLTAYWSGSYSSAVTVVDDSAVFVDPVRSAAVVSRAVSVVPSQGSVSVTGSGVVFDGTGLDADDYSFSVVYTFDDARVVTASYTAVVLPVGPVVPTGGSSITGQSLIPVVLLFLLAGACFAVRTRRLG
ncbi:MAG: leucine-rich repeat domain-containing protein [Propionibacteriaceae bacterium]|nr:leucine-rich repeat domain-containing protein [Propionibacteriaceae bacterium]